MSTAQLEDAITTPSLVTGDGQPLAQQQNKHKEDESDHWQPDNIANECIEKEEEQGESNKQNESNAIKRSKIEKDAAAVNRGNSNNQKLHFRQPQQGSLSRKLWNNKPFKARLYYQQCIKADMENLQNLKNQAVHRKQHPPKNIKQNYNKMINNRTAQFSIRSKFFLPDKRPRKEIIIPPTKFLLGGNISDPLNLNSLQDEALNATPNQTPRQSPITTPPKVEVIIPPNIYDPLHLLDPVDSIEYEKQLVSPMKRKSKSKHRNRKKKPKRKRMNDSASDSSIITTMATTTTAIIPPCTILVTTAIATAPAAVCTISAATSTTTAISSELLETSASSLTGDTSGDLLAIHTDDEEKCVDGGAQNDVTVEGGAAGGGDGESSVQPKENNNESASKLMLANSSSLAVRRSIDREKVTRDLRLDLNGIGGGEQQQMGIGGGRKRRISEGPNSTKNKFRRMDSMDKIVSPVVPQPGAWKRPPRTVPTGARKGSRLRSTSVSETDLISPTDDNKTIESESIRGDTPDIEAQKQFSAGSSTVADISVDVLSQEHQQQYHQQQQHQQQEEQEPIPKFKPDGARFQYGNYDRYSGYRNLNEIMDVRLQVFRRHGHLFRGKDILDIGCNVGHITMAVAKDLTPKSILGLDIDRNLIMRARKNLSFYVKIPNYPTTNSKKNITASSSSGGKSIESVNNSALHGITSTNATSIESTSTTTISCAPVGTTKQQSAEPNESENHNSCTDSNKLQSKKNLNAKRKTYQKPKIEREKHQFFPISFPITYGGVKELSSYTQNKDDSSPACIPDSGNEFPKNVFFRAANYVLKDESMIYNESQQYDVILCLSVTKWIHLNFGDAGLKQAFKRMFNQLRPGGKLILEAQNWASYKKKKNLTETIYNNYRHIDFFPNKFHEYLLGSEVGFSHSYCLGVPRHMNKGFCRPIQLYAKGDYTPSHIQWSDNYHPQTPYEAYRGIYAGITRPAYPLWGGYDTPHGNSGSYSCRQTPHHGISTSQYYNPLETDSYLPSYDTQITNRHYVFASPLYQTVWSPPASLRNASNKTPKFGSIREIDADDGGPVLRHVYPPNGLSPQASGSGSAFNSFREPDLDDYSQHAQTNKPHVYANCDNSSSPKIHNSLSPKIDNSSSPKVDNSSSSPKVNNSSSSPKVENLSSSPSNSSTPHRNQSDSIDDTEIESMMNADNIEGN